MARNERTIRASPQAVFEVLADPRSYAYWVLGSLKIRDADADWPRKGSRFHHTVGMGPFRVEDHTVVEEVEPVRFLQLETKARPLGNARVKLTLDPVPEGTRVTMNEDPADKPTAFVFMPLSHLLLWGRNVRSLERLAELAEGRRPIPGDEKGAPTPTLDGAGSVDNPEARRRREGRRRVLALAGRAALAGASVALAVVLWGAIRAK